MTGWITTLARAGLVFAVVLGLFAGAIPPSAVRADTNLTVGGTARIAYANGDPVRFRTYPGSDAPVITSLSEGTLVSVLEGPVDDGAGLLWYQISVDGQAGFVAEMFLAAGGGELSNPAETDATDDTGSTNPAPINGPSGTISGTNGEGARCRVAADAEADIIVVLPEGTVVALNGERAGDWQPVVCEGQPGFVATQFIVITGAPEPEPVAEEPVATEEPQAEPVVTEEPVEVETEEATEEPAPEVTEEVTEEVADEEEESDNGDAEGDAEATEEAVETEEEDVTEEPADEATEEATDEATAEATEEVTPEPTDEATAEPTDEATATEEPTETETPEATETAEPAETPESTPIPEPIAGVTPDATQEAVQPALGTPVLSGTAIVLGTNGHGLRCRTVPERGAPIITILAERSVVSTRGAEQDGWLPIVCDGQDGFANADYLLLDRLGNNNSGTGATDDVAATATQATVSGTNGSGLRCRSQASTSGSVIVVLREGSTVALRSGSTGEWTAVVCDGRNGFVSNAFLSFGGGVAAATLTNNTGSTGTAIVSGTNGDGLRCRSGASYSASVLLVLREGAKVALRGNASNGWQPVYCGSSTSAQAGFVVSDYLSGQTQQSDTSSSGSGSSLGNATVSTASGNGARLRARASGGGAIIMIVPNGTVVTLRSGSSGDWTAVRYAGSNGFIHNSLLRAGGTTPTTTAPTGGLVKGDRAEVTSNLNLRYSASYSAGIAAVAPAGTVVKITGSATSGFYPVDWDGLTGYMHGDYLTKTSKALSTRGGSGSTTGGSTSGGTTTGGGGTSATGNSMVDFAMQYIGYPYVWATAGPSSFDCSGFTYWVTKNVLGQDIGRGLWTQVAAGTNVSRSSLQPGDLVFFQNTYTWGLSHVGIYIGNDKFIHAQNESTGVVISDLNSTYYGTRWYGAVRLS